MRLRNDTTESIKMIVRNEDGFAILRSQLPSQSEAVFSLLFEIQVEEEGPTTVVRLVASTRAPAPGILTGGGDPTEHTDGEGNVAASGLIVRNLTEGALRFDFENNPDFDFELLPQQLNTAQPVAQVEIRRDQEGVFLQGISSVPL